MKTSGANSEHKHSEIKRFWTLNGPFMHGDLFCSGGCKLAICG